MSKATAMMPMATAPDGHMTGADKGKVLYGMKRTEFAPSWTTGLLITTSMMQLVSVS